MVPEELLDALRSDITKRVEKKIEQSDKIDSDLSYEIRWDSKKFTLTTKQDIPESVNKELNKILGEALAEISSSHM